MATTPDLQEPQIAAARATAWHQTGDPLLTLEAARDWLNECGLLLFSPRGAALGAPAPSLVEATLASSKATATLAESETARTLVARLVGEGSALPLNLLGGPGDLPDFLVSAQSFPFIFTLRGDKGWKRPPEISGSVKVTPLGLRVHELLTEKGALTVSDLVTEIGREITESAVARSLSELWQMLRVVPVLQQGQGDTLWELTTTRFLKAVKAGANAGQPTALSALVSLYLGQAYVASEEEIAAFLSPLTARSRVRDVLHGLTAGRQLAEGVIDGKAVLYLPDSLPDFAAMTADDGEAEAGADPAVDTQSLSDASTEESAPTDAPRERIRSFGEEGAPARDRNLRGKPLGRPRPGGASGSRFGGPPRDGASRGPREDRGGERRSFNPRAGSGGREGADKSVTRPRSEGGSSFARPWDEERAARPPRSQEGEGATAEGGSRPPRPERDSRETRPSRPFRDAGREGGRSPRSFGDRPDRPFRDRPAGDRGFRPRPEGGGDRPFRPRPEGGGDRPFKPRSAGGDRPFRPRPEGGGDRPFRPRPEGGGDRPFKPRSPGGDRPFRPRTDGGGDRPFRPRPEGSGDRPFKPRSPGGDRPFRPRTEGGGDRPFRPRPEGSGDRPFKPRSLGGDRPFKPRSPGGDRPFRPRTEGGDDRPFRPRPEGGGDRPFRPRPEGGGDRPFRPREGGSGDRRSSGGPPRFGGAGGARPDRPRTGGPGGFGAGRGKPSFGGRSGEGRPPRGDRPAGRPGAPGGFAPRREGGKPGNRPDRPARKPRSEDEA